MPRSKRPKPKRPSPDDLLARENYAELNEAFYRAEPHAYLLQRWQHLLLSRGAGDKLDALIEEGVEIEGMEYKGTLDDEPIEDSDKARERFVIAESEVLLHHVSETILRLYLAHRGSSKGIPPCPWLQLARVRAPGDFKRAVERLGPDLGSEDERDQIRIVFYGSNKREAFKSAVPDEAWIAGTDNIAKYLAHYASVFLAADSYNAAKHGLALLAGESKMALHPNKPSGDPEIDNLIKASGPSIEYLGVNRTQGGKPQWARKVKWLNLNRSMALAWVGCQLINFLWQVARLHYLKQMPVNGIPFFGKPTYEEVMKSTGSGEPIEIGEVSFHLLYYEKPPT